MIVDEIYDMHYLFKDKTYPNVLEMYAYLKGSKDRSINGLLSGRIPIDLDKSAESFAFNDAILSTCRMFGPASADDMR